MNVSGRSSEQLVAQMRILIPRCSGLIVQLAAQIFHAQVSFSADSFFLQLDAVPVRAASDLFSSISISSKPFFNHLSERWKGAGC